MSFFTFPTFAPLPTTPTINWNNLFTTTTSPMDGTSLAFEIILGVLVVVFCIAVIIFRIVVCGCDSHHHHHRRRRHHYGWYGQRWSRSHCVPRPPARRPVYVINECHHHPEPSTATTAMTAAVAPPPPIVNLPTAPPQSPPPAYDAVVTLNLEALLDNAAPSAPPPPTPDVV